jgi:hypothetical protein
LPNQLFDDLVRSGPEVVRPAPDDLVDLLKLGGPISPSSARRGGGKRWTLFFVRSIMRWVE